MEFAGGAIAIASIAIQLVDSIQKLCDLIETIKDAPANVQRIREELDVLQLVVTSIDQSMDVIDRVHGANPLRRSLDLCRCRFDRLARTTQDWQKGLDSGGGRRSWARLTAAFGKKKIDQFAVEIEAAKSSVLLALQPYYQ